MFVFMNQYLSVGTLDVIGDFSVWTCGILQIDDVCYYLEKKN